MDYILEIKKYLLSDLVEDKTINDIEHDYKLNNLIDSLNMVKLINFIEDKYELDLLESEIDINDFSTLNNIDDLIKKVSKIKS